MRIKKVKITSDEKVSMIFEKESKPGIYDDEYSFTCSEKARPEFYAAINALRKEAELYIKGDRAQGKLFEVA